jgi:DNA-binding response OmpR family regulator
MKTCPHCGHAIYKVPASFIAAVEAVDLARRERQILDVLIDAFPRRVSRDFIVARVYEDDGYTCAEGGDVVHSHISKMRTKLRAALGYDPISAKRFEGYRLVLPPTDEELKRNTFSPVLESASAEGGD